MPSLLPRRREGSSSAALPLASPPRHYQCQDQLRCLQLWWARPPLAQLARRGGRGAACGGRADVCSPRCGRRSRAAFPPALSPRAEGRPAACAGTSTTALAGRHPLGVEYGLALLGCGEQDQLRRLSPACLPAAASRRAAAFAAVRCAHALVADGSQPASAATPSHRHPNPAGAHSTSAACQQGSMRVDCKDDQQAWILHTARLPCAVQCERRPRSQRGRHRVRQRPMGGDLAEVPGRVCTQRPNRTEPKGSREDTRTSTRLSVNTAHRLCLASV